MEMDQKDGAELNRNQAWGLLCEYTQSESLRKHMLAVEACMRAQREHGGSAELFYPDSALLDQANEIASTVPQVRDSLYCRIDAVARDGKLVLMELELIEPELFLGLAEGAAERFAEAIARHVK
jgi:hypothetical protein